MKDIEQLMVDLSAQLPPKSPSQREFAILLLTKQIELLEREKMLIEKALKGCKDNLVNIRLNKENK